MGNTAIGEGGEVVLKQARSWTWNYHNCGLRMAIKLTVWNNIKAVN